MAEGEHTCAQRTLLLPIGTVVMHAAKAGLSITGLYYLNPSSYAGPTPDSTDHFTQPFHLDDTLVFTRQTASDQHKYSIRVSQAQGTATLVWAATRWRRAPSGFHPRRHPSR